MINIKPIDLTEWQTHQAWEAEWHADCANSFNEEAKQFTYARLMGLDEFKGYDRGGRLNWNYGDKSVIDIGGGAYSMLLKSQAKRRAVVDPCTYPNWTKVRYQECGIELYQLPAEEINEGLGTWDIALIYNCLQHTINPQAIIENAKKIAHEIRIFEWVHTGTAIGHPHDLTPEDLDAWLGGTGKVVDLNEGGCVGQCYYGIFPVKALWADTTTWHQTQAY